MCCHWRQRFSLYENQRIKPLERFHQITMMVNNAQVHTLQIVIDKANDNSGDVVRDDDGSTTQIVAVTLLVTTMTLQ